MSSTYTGNPANNPASITIPSDGDGPSIKAADVNVAFEALMDKIAYLNANGSGGSAANLAALQAVVTALGLAVHTMPSTVVRMIPLLPSAVTRGVQTRAASAWWSHDPNEPVDSITAGTRAHVVECRPDFIRFLQDGNATQGRGLLFNIDPYLIQGATIASVRAEMQAAPGHGSFPATSMSVGVWRSYCAHSLGVDKEIHALRTGSPGGGASGPYYGNVDWGTVGNYELPQDYIYVANQNNVIDKTLYNYWIDIWGEYGSPSICVGSVLYALAVTMNAIPDVRIQ